MLEAGSKYLKMAFGSKKRSKYLLRLLEGAVFMWEGFLHGSYFEGQVKLGFA